MDFWSKLGQLFAKFRVSNLLQILCESKLSDIAAIKSRLLARVLDVTDPNACWETQLT
jgi:hypothetical protein